MLLSRSGIIAASGVAASVQPTVVRSAEIGNRDAGALGWSSSGTFDASGTEPNRVLFLVLDLFSSDGSLETWTINTLTVGGVAATIAVAPITNAAAGRNCTTAIAYRINPPNNASLAIAWNLAISGGDDITAAKIYGALLQDTNQTDPVGNTATVNPGTDTSTTISIPITIADPLALILGGVASRRDNTAPHSEIDTETILLTGATGASGVLSAGASVFTKDPGGAGSKSAGVITSNPLERGGALVEVLPA